jgi:hypothetical protein
LGRTVDRNGIVAPIDELLLVSVLDFDRDSLDAIAVADSAMLLLVRAIPNTI